MEEGNLFAGGLGDIYEDGIKTFDVATREVGEKTTQGNKMIRLGDDGETLAIGFESVEAEAVFTQELEINIGWF